MFTVLFEARPEPGCYSAFRDHVTALQRAVGGDDEPIEYGEYRSVTREGWLLSLFTWSGGTTSASRSAAVRRSVRRSDLSLLLDWRSRSGEVVLDTEPSAGAAEAPQASRDGGVGDGDGTVTVLSGVVGQPYPAADDPQRRAEGLGLDTGAEGLITWDLFESPHRPGTVIALLTWRSQRAARDFEHQHELPAGVRLQRVRVVGDHCPARTPHPGFRRRAPVSVPPRLDARSEHERLSLLADAGATVGASLDLVGTAQALTDLLVPRLADVATVDVLDEVVTGEARPARRCLYRVASTMARSLGDRSAGPRGTPRCPPLPGSATPMEGPARAFGLADQEFDEFFGHDTQNSQYMMGLGVHEVAVVPLVAGTAGLGLLTLHRRRRPHGTFSGDELDSVQELAGRAATALENARVYMRERDMAMALRRAVLPLCLPATPALEVRHGFDPPGAGGRWYDVIRLPGARTALVVGDAASFGPSADVAAARLRSAVRALAALETSPQELLTRLNDLAVDLDADLSPATQGDQEHDQEPGTSTCLYLVYDPILADITFASAGHCPPVAAVPGAAAQVLQGMQGPGLGRPHEKYYETRLPAEPGTLLGLVAFSSPGSAPAVLQSALDQPGRDLDASFRAAARALAPSRPEAAPLLLARSGMLDPDQTAEWALASDIAIVRTARALTERRLDAWGLGEDTKLVTVLIVSELVTNAVRHASPPITLRLIRQETLTCEVSDGSGTAPHLQHALPGDEGGRGLFIVAESVSRWGIRHGPTGKTVWTEQELAWQ